MPCLGDFDNLVHTVRVHLWVHLRESVGLLIERPSLSSFVAVCSVAHLSQRAIQLFSREACIP